MFHALRAVSRRRLTAPGGKVCAWTGAGTEALESRVLLSGGPRLMSGTPVAGATIFTGDTWPGFQFDRPVRPVSGDDIKLTWLEQPGVRFTMSDIDLYGGGTTLNFRFRSGGANTGLLPVGNFELRLLSGDGHFEGLDGADLDGELGPDGALPSGDGEDGGDVVIPFRVVEFTNIGIAPRQLIAWPLSDHEIELQWRGDINYNYGFDVERATGEGAFEPLHRITNGGSGLFHYVDATAAPGEAYRYRVRGWGYDDNGPGQSDPSNEASSSVLAPNLSFPISTLSNQPGARPDWLTDVSGTVFFTLSSGAHPTNWRNAGGSELWKTDGTAEGTARLYTGPARDLVNVGGTLYFTGGDAEAGEELWKSDGTPEGTVRVADVMPGAASSSPRLLAATGGRLLFAVPVTGRAYEIWQTDGAAGGTVRVSDKLMLLDDFPDTSRSYRRVFAVSGGFLYFRASDRGGGDSGELWRVAVGGPPDGPVSAERVAGSIDPEWLTDFKGELFFAGDIDLAHPAGRGFFKVSGGAAPAAELIIPVHNYPTDWGYLAYVTPVGDYLMFSGETPEDTIQLYKSDGTAAGTGIFGHVNGTLSGVRQYDIVDNAGTAWFFNNDYPPSLWKSDGTVAGTAAVRGYDFTYSFPTHSPAFLLAAGPGRVVYSDARDLWHSDGTRTGSYKVAPLGPEAPEGLGEFGFGGRAALVAGNKVYFSTKRPDGGRELRVASLTRPAAPDGLTATPAEAPAPGARVAVAAAAPAAGVRLTWNDRSSNESAFVIERSTHADFSAVGRIFYQSPDASGMVDTSAVPGVTYYYRARAVNAAGASSYSNTAAPAVPRVTAVYVSGGAWADAFKARLQSDGLGSAAYGYAIFGPGDPATPLPAASAPLPWSNLDRVTVQIDPATPLSPRDLERLAAAMAGNTIFTGFAYDAAANTATWTAAPGALEGPVDITFDPGPLLPGPLHYRLNVLGGDVTRDGGVNALDLAALKRALNATTGTAAYSPFADVTGDGRINALDVGVLKQRLNRRLPTPAAEPAALPPSHAPAAPRRSDAPSEELFSAVRVLE